MTELETTDPEQAYAQMREFQDAEIERVVRELDEHHVDRSIIHRVQEKLEQPNTARVVEDDFTIVRNLNHGYDIEWRAGLRAA